MLISHGSSTASRARRLGAGLIALALVAVLGSTAGADTQSQLTGAQRRLAKLEATIQSQAQRAEAVRADLIAMQRKVDVVQESFDQVDLRLFAVREQLSMTQAQYDALQGQLDDLARAAYMSGSGSNLEMLLGATSMTDLNDRVEFMSDVTSQSAVLAGEVQGAAAELGARRSNLDRLLGRQADVLGDLNSSRASLASTLEAQSAALTDLSQTRDQIVTIIEHLSAKLQAEAIRGAGGVLQGGHNAPYGVWAAAFLQNIQAPTCFDNLVTMVAWQVQEGTTANWNPLATTYPMAGASDFNYVGVKNYLSMAQGLETTWRTLDTSAYGYPAILAALHHCPDAMVTAHAINASSWCRGCTGGRYVTGLIPTVEANYDTYAKL